MPNISKLLWGILLIILGLILGLNVLEITNINLFFKGWWTMFIIIPSFIGLFENKDKTIPVIGLIIGCMLFLATRQIINFQLIFKLIIPITFVSIGIIMIINELSQRKINHIKKDVIEESIQTIVAIFSAQKITDFNNQLETIDLEAIFGSIILDLRKVEITTTITIKANAIFGDIKIITPENTTIKLKSLPILGSISNQIKTKSKSNKIIYIDAFSMLGGIKIQ